MKNKNESFILEVIPSDLLEAVIDWINDNLTPDEVFDEYELEDWAEDNGFVREE